MTENLIIGETTDILLFNCPHCLGDIQVLRNEINCTIFRHGILKSNGEQISPHASKEECDNYVANDLIYGCGRPFKLIMKESIWDIEICDYI
jgi:hypothetical protein